MGGGDEPRKEEEEKRGWENDGGEGHGNGAATERNIITEVHFFNIGTTCKIEMHAIIPSIDTKWVREWEL